MIYVSEAHVNATEGYRTGEECEPYEVSEQTPGEVYRAFLRGFPARCTGKVYRDTPEGTLHIGWIFQWRDHYEDTGEPWLHEVWVTLHSAPPTRTITYHEIDIANFTRREEPEAVLDKAS